ncbi:MAG TPA: hypothetical protein DEQ09_03635 [Bacteroidales bacterium]|nr:hypothetical protein [Bacteroidales bacterium]
MRFKKGTGYPPSLVWVSDPRPATEGGTRCWVTGFQLLVGVGLPLSAVVSLDAMPGVSTLIFCLLSFVFIKIL